MSVFLVFGMGGIALFLLGIVLITDYKGVGEKIVERTIPGSFRVGTATSYRKKLGSGYLVLGILIAVGGWMLFIVRP